MDKNSDTKMQTADIIYKLVLDKYLYLILLMLLIGCSIPNFLNLCSNTESLIYMTADSNIIGNLSNRLFGLLTYHKCSIDTVFFLMKAVYIAVIPVQAYAVMLLLKQIKSWYYRFITMPAAIFFLNYLLNYWGESPNIPSFSVALTLILFAYYFLLFSEKHRYISVPLAVIAELIHCSTMLLILPAALAFYFIIKNKKGKQFKTCVRWLAGAVFSVFILLNFPILRSYYTGVSLPEEQITIEELQEKSAVLISEYTQYIQSEELKSHINSYLNTSTMDAFFRCSPLDSVLDSIDTLNYFKTVYFDETFQLSALIVFVLINVMLHIERADSEESSDTQQ